jgi:hypothetical protein
MSLKQRLKQTIAAVVPSFADALGQAQDELARIRDEIAQLRIEIEETEHRPASPAEAEARIDEVVAALAARARNELNTGVFLAARPGSADYLAQAALQPLDLVAFVAPDGLRAKLLALVRDAASVLPDGIDAAARHAELAKLRAQLQELERAEAERLWALEAAGMAAPWRGDLPAAIVLGLEPASQDQAA